MPGRPVHLGAGWLAQVDLAGGPVHVRAELAPAVPIPVNPLPHA